MVDAVQRAYSLFSTGKSKTVRMDSHVQYSPYTISQAFWALTFGTLSSMIVYILQSHSSPEAYGRFSHFIFYTTLTAVLYAVISQVLQLYPNKTIPIFAPIFTGIFGIVISLGSAFTFIYNILGFFPLGFHTLFSSFFQTIFGLLLANMLILMLTGKVKYQKDDLSEPQGIPFVEDFPE